jgi:hypothetical protein
MPFHCPDVRGTVLALGRNTPFMEMGHPAIRLPPLPKSE